MKSTLGVGYSGPAVAGTHLYVMGARGGKERLFAINVQDGDESWSAEIGDMLENSWGHGPRGTPTVSGQHVYALGAQGNLICAAAADGQVKWKQSLTDFGGKLPNWGYSESVLIDGDNVICTPGGDDGALLALHKETGETVWQSREFTELAQYSSVIAADVHGVHQLIQVTKRAVVGIAANSGTLLWKADWPGRTAVVPTPVFHDGHVYVTSGYNVGCGLFRISADNVATEVYSNRNMKNHHGGVVLLEDHVYGYSDGLGWVCQEFKTGEVTWRSKELGKGAVTCANEMLYCIGEQDGEVALVEATPESWKEVSRFTLQPQSELRQPRGRIWTHPVVADGKMYLRDQELLFCFDVATE